MGLDVAAIHDARTRGNKGEGKIHGARLARQVRERCRVAGTCACTVVACGWKVDRAGVSTEGGESEAAEIKKRDRNISLGISPHFDETNKLGRNA